MKKAFEVTALAPRELRRQADSGGVVMMTERQAEYELLRGTLVRQTPAVAAASLASAVSVAPTVSSADHSDES